MRIFPDKYASTRVPFSRVTRNMVFGKASVTVPEIEDAVGFSSLMSNGFPDTSRPLVSGQVTNLEFCGLQRVFCGKTPKNDFCDMKIHYIAVCILILISSASVGNERFQAG